MTGLEYDLARCTRRCAATDRELAPGETFYTVLRSHGEQLIREDYCVSAWSGPPGQNVVGWWQSRMPTPQSRRAKLAPSQVLLELLTELQAQPGKESMRYVLALLLVRRRICRLEETQTAPDGRETLVLYSPKDEITHHVPVAAPSETEAAALQDELARLLFAEGS